jgi:hypothetical protein
MGNRVETREDGLILAVRFSMELKSVAEAVYTPKLVGKGLWCISWRLWWALQTPAFCVNGTNWITMRNDEGEPPSLRGRLHPLVSCAF